MLTLKNGTYLTPAWEFKRGDIVLEQDKIISVGESAFGEGTVIDVKGSKIIPGLIDIHTHGAIGIDVMTASPAQIATLSKFLACNGVTAYLPTTVTDGVEAINKAVKNVKIAAENQTDGATIEGVHIEGPYIAHEHKGCHNESDIKLPDIDEYNTIRKILGEKLIIRVTVAPEIQGGSNFIKYVTTHGGFISIGHSDGYSDVAKLGLASGANSFTHLFNGMTGIHHREPGFAGEGLMSGAYIEVICDKMHIHPEVIKMISRIKGIDEIVLITDAMLATGLGDGEYEFGGFEIKVDGGLAQTTDGTIAGSTLTLLKGLKNWTEITGMPLEKALKAATINPARAIGIDSKVGSIEVGKRADIVVLDGDMNIKYTFCKGKKVFSRNNLAI
jgi:N-acetylglucosamine-6-phosphate deacetylase